jgi:phage FluMu gp28-like protein
MTAAGTTGNKGVLDLAKVARAYFLPYQLKWITDEHPRKLYSKSRRVGITFATSYRAVRKCMRNTGFKQWVSSRDLGTAREFIVDYVAKWCKLANIAASGLLAENIELIDADKDLAAFVVTFPNGSRIMSLSSNPKAFAGKGGDILLDEMDLHKDQDILYAMAQPCTTWGGQLEIVSAFDPEGTDESCFAQLVAEAKTDNPMDWSYHETTLQDAVDAGLVEKTNADRARRVPPQPPLSRQAFIDGQRKQCRTVSAWDTQYCGKPNSAHGQGAITPADLRSSREVYDILRIHLEGDAVEGQKVDPSVQATIDDAPWRALGLEERRCALGYDVARNGHLSSVWLDVAEGAGWKQVMLITLHGCKFTSQEMLINQLLTDLPQCVGGGDSTGLGMSTCENLFDDFPERLICINFSASKNDLGTLLTETFEKGLQVIPVDPAEISEDLKGIHKDTSLSTKKLTYTESENRVNPLSHCDIAWSCAMAKFAGRDLIAAPFESDFSGAATDGNGLAAGHPAAEMAMLGGCML